MQFQLKVTEIVSGKVLHHWFGSQTALLSAPAVKGFLNNTYMFGAHKLEYFNPNKNVWFDAKVSRHRDGSSRSLILSYKVPSIAEAAANMVELDKPPVFSTPKHAATPLGHGGRIYRIIKASDIHKVKTGQDFEVIKRFAGQKGVTLNALMSCFRAIPNPSDYLVLVEKAGCSEILVGKYRPSGLGLKSLSEY